MVVVLCYHITESQRLTGNGNNGNNGNKGNNDKDNNGNNSNGNNTNNNNNNNVQPPKVETKPSTNSPKTPPPALGGNTTKDTTQGNVQGTKPTKKTATTTGMPKKKFKIKLSAINFNLKRIITRQPIINQNKKKQMNKKK